MQVLSDAFPLPPYLLRVLKDCLRDRHITYVMQTGFQEKKNYSWSNAGLDSWPRYLECGLRRGIGPSDVYLVGYADHLVIVIKTRDTRLAQMRLSQATRQVDGWIQSRVLQLAMQKTELLYLTRKRIDTTIPMTVGSVRQVSGSDLKYADDLLITHTGAVRAALMIADLVRFMGNTKGPRPIVRLLLMTVTYSILRPRNGRTRREPGSTAKRLRRYKDVGRCVSRARTVPSRRRRTVG